MTRRTLEFRATLRKELATMWRDRRLVWSMGLVAGLYVASLALGWVAHARAHREHASATALARQEWLEQGVRNPHDAGHWGTFVFKRPHPLAIVERGAGDYLGTWLRLETHRQNDPQHRAAKEATGLFRLGAFTPMTVALVLLPLVLLVMTHPVVCGEDENGTAPLLRATGLSTATLARAKVMASLAFMGVWVVPLLLLTAVVVSLAPGGASDVQMAIAITALAIVLYCVAFTLAGVALSALCRDPRQTLAVGFGLWALTCVVLPRLATSVADLVAPAPSAFAFREGLEAHRGNKWTIPYRSRGNFMQVYSSIERRLLREQGVSSADSLTVDPFGLAIEETEEEGQRAYDATYGTILDRFRRQDALAGAAVAVTPHVALRRVATTLSRSDLESHRDFVDAAERYRRALMRRLNLDIAYHAMASRRPGAGGTGYVREHERGETFWRTFDEFEPPDRAGVRTLAATAPGLAGLGAWVALGLFAAPYAIRRRWGR